MQSNNKLMKHIHVSSPGDWSVMKLKQSPVPSYNHDTEYLLKISATAINRAEIGQRKGLYPPVQGVTEILGLEACGTINEGENQQSVMALLSGGSYSQYAVVNKEHVIQLPQNLKIEDGAAICEAWITAFMIVKYLGKIQKGDYVLVYAAASGVGTAAIQLIQHYGGIAIASSSTDEKLDFCQKIGADHTINYKKEGNQKDKIQEITNGKGLNLVLDCVGSQNADLTISSLTIDGRWVLYGTLGGGVIENFPLGALLGKRINLISTTLKSRSDDYQSKLIQQFKSEVIPGFENGTFQTIIDQILPLNWDKDADLVFQKAHQIMESNQNIGKIVVQYEEFQ